MAMAAASSLIRRASSQLLRVPPPRPMLPYSSSSTENPFAPAGPAPCLPEFPLDSGDSMDLMAVPKKKVSRYKKGLRNGPKALKPTPVIVRCKACGRVKLPHFYCCSGDRGVREFQFFPHLMKSFLVRRVPELAILKGYQNTLAFDGFCIAVQPSNSGESECRWLFQWKAGDFSGECMVAAIQLLNSHSLWEH